MAEILRLASSQSAKPVRGCGTCLFFQPSNDSVMSHGCRATGTYADMARHGECADGKLWEAKPAKVPVLIALKRWLVG